MGTSQHEEADALIEGWRALVRYTGYWKHHLRRWAAYGDFPKPLATGGGRRYQWRKSEVDSWLNRKLNA